MNLRFPRLSDQAVQGFLGSRRAVLRTGGPGLLNSWSGPATRGSCASPASTISSVTTLTSNGWLVEILQAPHIDSGAGWSTSKRGADDRNLLQQKVADAHAAYPGAPWCVGQPRVEVTAHLVENLSHPSPGVATPR